MTSQVYLYSICGYHFSCGVRDRCYLAFVFEIGPILHGCDTPLLLLLGVDVTGEISLTVVKKGLLLALYSKCIGVAHVF